MLSQRRPRDVRYISRPWAVAKIWPFEIILDGGSCHLKFIRIENSAIRSDPPSPKTPPYNQTWSGSDHPLQRYGHSRMLGAYGTHILGGRGGRRGSAMAPLERAMVVFYRLISIVTVALSVTIRPQFANECFRRSNQQEGGSLWAQI